MSELETIYLGPPTLARKERIVGIVVTPVSELTECISLGCQLYVGVCEAVSLGRLSDDLVNQGP